MTQDERREGAHTRTPRRTLRRLLISFLLVIDMLVTGVYAVSVGVNIWRMIHEAGAGVRLSGTMFAHLLLPQPRSVISGSPIQYTAVMALLLSCLLVLGLTAWICHVWLFGRWHSKCEARSTESHLQLKQLAIPMALVLVLGMMLGLALFAFPESLPSLFAYFVQVDASTQCPAPTPYTSYLDPVKSAQSYSAVAGILAGLMLVILQLVLSRDPRLDHDEDLVAIQDLNKVTTVSAIRSNTVSLLVVTFFTLLSSSFLFGIQAGVTQEKIAFHVNVGATALLYLGLLQALVTLLWSLAGSGAAFAINRLWVMFQVMVVLGNTLVSVSFVDYLAFAHASCNWTLFELLNGVLVFAILGLIPGLGLACYRWFRVRVGEDADVSAQRARSVNWYWGASIVALVIMGVVGPWFGLAGDVPIFPQASGHEDLVLFGLMGIAILMYEFALPVPPFRHKSHASINPSTNGSTEASTNGSTKASAEKADGVHPEK